MHIETNRLIITKFTMDMAEAVHIGSLDEDTRRFVPDEVFETVEEAEETLSFLISVYERGEGPLVYPLLLKNGSYIGYIQAVPQDEGKWEIGCHVIKSHTGQGYAKEAVKAFLPHIMPALGISSIHGTCLAENIASVKVLERCGFVRVYEGSGNYQGAEREICSFLYHLTAKSGKIL